MRFRGCAPHEDFGGNETLRIHVVRHGNVSAEAITAGNQIYCQSLANDARVPDQAGDFDSLAVLRSGYQPLDIEAVRYRQWRHSQLVQFGRRDNWCISARMRFAIHLEHFSGFRTTAIEIIHKHAPGCVLNEEPAFQYGVRCRHNSLNGGGKAERGAFRWKGNDICRIGQRRLLRQNGRLIQQQNAGYGICRK
jgi:hypothetical protein